MSTLMKKITAVMVVLSIIASIALIAVCADTPAIENKVLYDFDSLSDVPDSISSTSKLTLNSLAVYCENRTGKSLKATVASGTVFEIKTPAGEAFEGQGITFWYKTTGTKKAVFKVALVTKDNKQFEMSENLVCENKDGAAVLLEYADFAYSGAAITEEEIADIDFLRLTAIDGTTASTTLYLDTISLKLKDAEPAPTYTVLESVDMSKVKLINGKYTELSADAKTFTWTVKDEAVYAEEKIGEYIEIPVKNIKDLVSKRDAAYMIMEVRAPRQTKLTFSLTNADDTKKYGVDVGAMQNVTDADGFVKVKVALADFNVGFSGVSSISRLTLEVSEEYKSNYNCLYAGEGITYKDIRFTAEDPGEDFYTLSQIVPHATTPLTEEEFEAQETFAIYDMNDFSQTVYSNLFDQWNMSQYGTSASMDYGTLKKSHPYYRYFGKYAQLTVVDQDKFYSLNEGGEVKADEWGMHTFIEGSLCDVKDTEQYIDTATLTFWAAATKDMMMYVNIVNRTTYKYISYPFLMEATADGEFKQYSIKLKDIYQWNIENQPEKFYMHTPRECGEISFLPVDPTPEGYMGNDDYFRIAGIYLWSKEPKEINRLELHGEEFHGTENGVAVDSYRGGVPSDTILRVKDVTATSSEYQPIFGGKAKIESMMNVGLYNPETGGKVSASRKFWISLKVPENVSPFDLTVYRVYIDGTAEEVTSVIEDDSLAIYTYDAGIYALVSGEVGYEYKAPTESQNKSDEKTEETSPPTGDNSLAAMIFVMSLAVLGVSYSAKKIICK